MKIRYIETASLPTDPCHDVIPRVLIITVDELEIRVYGYGCGSYVLRLAPLAGLAWQDATHPDKLLREIADGMSGAAENTDEDVRRLFGVALGVWCSPETIAHVVTQVLYGQ